MPNEIEATAHAVQAVAEATGEGIKATAKLGRWLSDVFGPALNEFGGMAHDQVRYMRSVRMMKLANKFED